MIVRLHLVAYALPFSTPVESARGAARVRAGTLVVAEDARGRQGLGDASPWPTDPVGQGEARPAAATEADAGARATRRALEEVRERLAAGALALPLVAPGAPAGDARSLDALAAAVAALRLPAAAACGLEQAALDLAARAAGLPLAALLAGAGPARARVATHALVADPAQAHAAVTRGLERLKVKVAARSLAEDDYRLARLRARVPAHVRLRLDANGGWDALDAVRALRRLAAYGVDWVEQPVPPGDLAALARVRQEGGVAVLVDEGLPGPDDGAGAAELAATLEALARVQAADGVVLKPQRLGGLLPCLAAGRRAAALGLGVLVTSSLESVVGRRGALHLAAALPGAAGGLLGALARDLGPEPPLAAGALERGGAPGIGLEPTAVLAAARAAAGADGPLAPGRQAGERQAGERQAGERREACTP